MASSNATSKIEIDDTVPLSCNFLATETLDDHVVYLIKVQRGHDPKYSWQIRKRYNEFNELYAQLRLTNYELPLPPKKAFGNMKREFLSTRQNGLQEFMDKILSNLLLANTLPVKKFLDEENYSQNYSELALAHVSMCFRSESNWEIIETLKKIGWRIRKHHVMLKNSDNPNNKYILTWYEHGLDKFLKENELKQIFNQFTQIQHENIEPIVRIDSGETSTIMIQKFNDKLISLKDYIYGASKINSNYLKKYSFQKSTTTQTLSTNLIKLIAKKILLALQFIYSKGLFYGQLHSGNILIEQNGNTIRLTDLPNSILGLPYFYRSFVIDHRKIQNLEFVDVYGFGHVLYEMVYGESLLIESCKKEFNDCPNRDLKPILELILTEDALKNGLPTISELLENPFFKNIDINVLPTSSMSAAVSTSNASQVNSKLFSSPKLKELLVKAREFIEKRMNDEQKTLYKIKRQSKAEAKVLSEEEIRKRRKEKKKAEKELINNSLEFPTSQSTPLKINTNGSLSSSFKSDSIESYTNSPVSISSPSANNKSIPPPPAPPLPMSSPILSSSSSSSLPPPPPPAPPLLKAGSAPPPPPPPPALAQSKQSNSNDRSALLSSINTFSKTGLKKTKTNDRSVPKV